MLGEVYTIHEKALESPSFIEKVFLLCSEKGISCRLAERACGSQLCIVNMNGGDWYLDPNEPKPVLRHQVDKFSEIARLSKEGDPDSLCSL